MHKIMVYGTLKHGFGNHRLLEGAAFLGEAITEPRFTMVSLGGFPGIIEQGSTPISGEIYEVDAPTLKRLDRLEGHPDWYTRTPITATLSDGQQVNTEIYILPESYLQRGPVVASGVWERDARLASAEHRVA